ncbi:MAG TPA: hypothetical protein VN181_10250, partial [Thermoanaerobaculia bacterium]|nr:hypothetical protein [Thermoanaerobaculia bacterium]
GRFEFAKIPSGFISILAAEFSLTRESAGVDLDLKPDTTLDQTLVLHVPNAVEQAQLATVEGDVKRDDPTWPNDRTRDVLVPNAVVSIRGLAPVVADANGHYVATGVPVSMSGKSVVSVFDPATGRRANASMPNPLTAGASNTLPLLLRTAVPQGTATFRVRLTAASGEAVTDYRVIWPGYPPDELTHRGGGIYELTANVPQTIDVWAVPHGRHPKYGDQFGHTTMRADFDGQIVVHDVRLPGQGSVKARVLVQKRCPDATPDCPVEYDVGAGTIGVAYSVWHDGEQSLVVQDREPVATDPVTGIATINGVPAGNASVETLAHPSGYASGNVFIRFDADERPIDLRLSTLGNVSGRVVDYDGVSPIAGATVRFNGNLANLGTVTTGADGTFRFNAVGANQNFTLVAEGTDNGVYRTGTVNASTPPGGGPVSGLVIVMRQQANVDGIVVDSSNVPVPQARYWARELVWPYRQFGSSRDPLIAGNDGRFFLNNVFTGGVRITAVSPVHQEDRGDAQVDLGFEGDNRTNIRLTIGSAGTSTISVTVFDSSNGYMLVPNAEVTLYRDGGAFDFASTNQNGVVSFENVPVAHADGSQATYVIRATSKVVGRAGAVGGIVLTRDVPKQVQVALTLTGRVSGTLVDGDFPSLPPVRGMPVYLYQPSFYTVTSTGRIGDFLFNGVPEGSLRLEALDTDSGRKAYNTTPLFIDKLFPDRADVLLKLEKTATLKVKVYLPDDAGGASSVLAPLVDVKVTQPNYSRELQGVSSELNFAKMFTNREFHIEARELGGENRIIRYDGSIPPETFSPEVSLHFTTSGTVRVEVTADDASLIAGSSVVIGGAGKGASVFADATGIITINDMPLGNVSVQVVSGALSASASGTLASHSVPLVL